MMQKSRFSKREQDVIALLVKGNSNKQISLALGISQRTVEYHITNILAKLNVSSRTEAVIKLSEPDLRISAGDSDGGLQESLVDLLPSSSENETKQNAPRRITVKRILLFVSIPLIIIACFLLTYVRGRDNQGKNPISQITAETESTSAISSSTATAQKIPSEIPRLTTTTEFIPTPVGMPIVVSPLFPNENVYPPALPLQFGAWPATGGCPNLVGVEDYAALLPEVVTDVLQKMATGERLTEFQWTDPAYWPVMVNPFKGEDVTQDWIRQITRAEDSPYGELVKSQCGDEVAKLSWYVQACPGPCQTSAWSESLMINMLFIPRWQWLVWALW